jgi:hypothetical protein
MPKVRFVLDLVEEDAGVASDVSTDGSESAIDERLASQRNSPSSSAPRMRQLEDIAARRSTRLAALAPVSSTTSSPSGHGRTRVSRGRGRGASPANAQGMVAGAVSFSSLGPPPPFSLVPAGTSTSLPQRRLPGRAAALDDAPPSFPPPIPTRAAPLPPPPVRTRVPPYFSRFCLHLPANPLRRRNYAKPPRCHKPLL